MILTLTAFVYALFGLIIGSFLNVVILRHGAKSVGGRSGCLSCGAPLHGYDMVPIFSWLALGGRCRACGSYISIQYPLVEATTAILFAFVGMASLVVPISLLLTIIALIIVALLILIATYDIRHTIIPDEWVYAFAVLAFIASLPFALSSLSQGGFMGIILLVLAGPVTALPLFALWAISSGRWMGFGDVKLALGIGWLLGLSAGLSAIFLAFVIGAAVSLGILFVQHLKTRRSRVGRITKLGIPSRGLTMKSEVPFGPFLIAACICVWLMMMFSVTVPILNPFLDFFSNLTSIF
jgi:leader peptidase (prepilin peptidase)/N-methyltransferase